MRAHRKSFQEINPLKMQDSFRSQFDLEISGSGTKDYSNCKGTSKCLFSNRKSMSIIDSDLDNSVIAKIKNDISLTSSIVRGGNKMTSYSSNISIKPKADSSTCQNKYYDKVANQSKSIFNKNIHYNIETERAANSSSIQTEVSVISKSSINLGCLGKHRQKGLKIKRSSRQANIDVVSAFEDKENIIQNNEQSYDDFQSRKVLLEGLKSKYKIIGSSLKSSKNSPTKCSAKRKSSFLSSAFVEKLKIDVNIDHNKENDYDCNKLFIKKKLRSKIKRKSNFKNILTQISSKAEN
ncbi:unnamed protein product [Moneuplotes crassus]|uniref:Uncharacterized protein n=1 Tax=Euplotes crassus TaxID=5936 RepID=A0AAD1Y4G2_EUPCR|nr:unnamed protein product [Moneuplotes crassus]